MNNHTETIKCPYCGEDILATAKKCKHCGEWIKEEDSSSKTIRAAVEEAKWNDDNSGALAVQVGIIAIVLGIIYKSWWIGLGAFIGLGVLIFIPYIGIIVCILMSGLYAFIGFKIGAFFFSNEAGWVIAILVGIGSLGINLSSRKWLKDF